MQTYENKKKFDIRLFLHNLVYLDDLRLLYLAMAAPRQGDFHATAARRSTGNDDEAGIPASADEFSPHSEDGDGPSSNLEALFPVSRITAGASWAFQSASNFAASAISSDTRRAAAETIQNAGKAIASSSSALVSSEGFSNVVSAASTGLQTAAAWTASGASSLASGVANLESSTTGTNHVSNLVGGTSESSADPSAAQAGTSSQGDRGPHETSSGSAPRL